MDPCSRIDAFLRRWATTPARQRPVLAARDGLPIADLQQAALRHGDPWIRRTCLDFLDHHANDASAAVFARALTDPVAIVRLAALHGLACERCRSGPLCATDVAPAVAEVAVDDPSPDVRHAAVPILLRLSDRSPVAGDALRAAGDDADPLVRHVARAALDGDAFEAGRSRRTLRRRSRARAAKADAGRIRRAGTGGSSPPAA